MQRKILIVGYGSMGKRHARNLIALGITPYILTNHPDKLNANFLKDIHNLRTEKIEHSIISSPTARHLNDVKMCVMNLKGLKKILIEKPLEHSYLRGEAVRNIAKKHKLKVFVAYNLRFIGVFAAIAKFIKRQKNKIRIVEAVAGQDIREWRPYKHIRQSYSAYRERGGGVDLDLSHEIDYVLWLFQDKFKHKVLYRTNISDLQINSPDFFKMILDYKKFIVDITLDYIRRPKERYLKIICDNGKRLSYDFLADGSRGINNSYKKMLRVFLGIDKAERNKLCSVEESLNVLRVLGV